MYYFILTIQICMYVLLEKKVWSRVETGAQFEINLDLTHSNEDKEGRIGNPFFLFLLTCVVSKL